MRDTQKWCDTIWIVRHGESAGNVARDALAIKFHTLFPEISNDLLTLMSHLLPEARDDKQAKQSRTGYESRAGETTIAKLLGTPAIKRNNEAG